MRFVPSPANARVAPLTVAVGSMTVTERPSEAPVPSAVAVAAIVEAAPGSRPDGAPRNASTVPEMVASALAPSPPARPKDFTFDVAAAVYFTRWSVVPAVTVRESALRSTPSRTYASVCPVTCALGSMTLTSIAPAPVPSAVACASSQPSAATVTAPPTVTVEVTFRETSVEFAPMYASTVPETVAFDLIPAPEPRRVMPLTWLEATACIAGFVGSARLRAVAVMPRLPAFTFTPSPT